MVAEVTSGPSFPSSPRAAAAEKARRAWIQHILETLEGDAARDAAGQAADWLAMPAALLELVDHPENFVRIELASNPATPDAVLHRLAEDEDEWVRYLVGANPLRLLSSQERLDFRMKQDAALGEMASGSPGSAVETFLLAVVELVGPWDVTMAT